MMRQLTSSLLVVVALSILPAMADDGAIVAERQASRRLIHLFDFEERSGPEPNFEDLPKSWYVMGRPNNVVDPNFLRQPVHRKLLNHVGFNRHTKVRFDRQHKVSGDFSFYLGLNGGSSGAFLDIGATPVIAETDFLITAKLRTSVMRHGGARLVAYFVDDHGNRIDKSMAITETMQTDGQWQSIAIELRGDFPKAAYLGLQLETLQHQFDPQSPLGKRQIIYREVEGGAWFDDIAIWQLPLVQMRTQSQVNILREPEKPLLTFRVHGLTGRFLMADVGVYDEQLQRVAHHQYGLSAGTTADWQWIPDLPRHGWYLADLNIYEQQHDRDGTLDSLVARSMTAFTWLGAESSLGYGDPHRFVIVAEQLSNDQINLFSELLDAVDLSTATISAWGANTSDSTIGKHHQQLSRTLHSLLTPGRQISLSLDPVPIAIAQQLHVDANSPILMFGESPKLWMPYLGPLLLKHGKQVHYWQIGSATSPLDPVMANLPQLATSAVQTFEKLVPQPRIILPWRLDHPRRPNLPDQFSFVLAVPESIEPEQIGVYAQPWQQSPPAKFDLHLMPPPATRIHHPGRIDDLVLRMLHGWEAGAARLSISTPWTQSGTRQAELLPDPLLGVFSTVAHRLAGRRALGRMPIGEGMHCIIFDGPAGGMLAMWNRSAPDEHVMLDMWLGKEPVAIDVWGNRTPLMPSDGGHRLAVPHTPIFIEGIDADLSQFRAAFAIEPAFIESKQTLHERTIHLSNPWPRTINGSMQIINPKNWQVQPSIIPFSLAAGQSMEIPVLIHYPVSEVAGPKRLVARFDFMADQHYTVDLSAPMELGLSNIKLDANLILVVDPDTSMINALATEWVTNSGDQPVALYAYASMANYPRQEQIISQLLPGKSIIRRFRFDDVGDDPSQVKVRVGLREPNGPASLHQVLTVGPSSSAVHASDGAGTNDVN